MYEFWYNYVKDRFDDRASMFHRQIYLYHAYRNWDNVFDDIKNDAINSLILVIMKSKDLLWFVKMKMFGYDKGWIKLNV